MTTPKRNDIVVLVAPLHGVTATRAELDKARNMHNHEGHSVDVTAYSEGYAPKRKGFFGNVPRRKHFTGPRTQPDARGRIASWDVIIETRRHFKTIWKHAAKWAEAARPLKIAPVRWGVEWDLLIRGHKYAFIFDHPHAGIDATPAGEEGRDRLEKYKGQAASRRRAILSALGRGLSVVAGGDLNYPPGTGYEWTPQRVFEGMDMQWRSIDVTWVAWSKDLELVKLEIITRTVNGQDHNWLLATFRRKA